MNADEIKVTAPVEGEKAAGESEASIASELRALGERLTAAVRAAASTDEATALANDVRDNVRRLRVELEEALRRIPEVARRGGEAATQEVEEVAGAASATVGGGVSSLRRDVGNAIASLGRTIERLGASLNTEGSAVAAGAASDEPGPDTTA